MNRKKHFIKGKADIAVKTVMQDVKQSGNNGELCGFWRKSIVNDNVYKFRIKFITAQKNAFKPMFYGKISNTDDGCVLVGKFKFMLLTRLFMTIWFLLLIIGCIAIDLLQGKLPPTSKVIVGIVFIIIGLLIQKGFGNFSKSNKEIIEAYLAEKIRQMN